MADYFGLWLSLVERLVRDQEAVGSNPTSPISPTNGGNVLLLRAAQPKNRAPLRGSCENLTERIRRHDAGDSNATKHGVPWVLVHSESFATRSEAAQRERYYKTGRGRDELAKLR